MASAIFAILLFPVLQQLAIALPLGESRPRSICASTILVIEQQSVIHSKGDRKSGERYVTSF